LMLRFFGVSHFRGLSCLCGLLFDALTVIVGRCELIEWLENLLRRAVAAPISPPILLASWIRRWRRGG
jgi:hypothetical protein